MTLRCEVCDSLLDEEELFCPNCGAKAPHAEAQRPADTARLATDNFACSGCGASMSYDASAQALRCPFCGSVDLVKRDDARILAPQRVVPLTYQRADAEAAMRRWLGQGFWRPGNLAREAAIVKMTPVYVPYWVFHAKTFTYWAADTDRTPPGARAAWYPLSGEHRGQYPNLLIGASKALSPRETSRLCPFDLSAGVPPEKVDLDNITVEQFSVPRKYARPLARQGFEQLESDACAQTCVPGRARNVHVNVRIEELNSEPVLLPVWIMAYRFGDRVFRFLVNGQTGRATGDAPVSWKKIAVALGIAAAVVLAAIVWLYRLKA